MTPSGNAYIFRFTKVDFWKKVDLLPQKYFFLLIYLHLHLSSVYTLITSSITGNVNRYTTGVTSDHKWDKVMGQNGVSKFFKGCLPQKLLNPLILCPK